MAYIGRTGFHFRLVVCRHERLCFGARRATATLCGLSRQPGAGRRASRSRGAAANRTVRVCFFPGNARASSLWRRGWLPDDVQRMHQSLHHFVANAPWSDEALLERCATSPAGDEAKPIRDSLDCGRYGLPEERNPFRRGDAPVLRTVGEAGKLPCSG